VRIYSRTNALDLFRIHAGVCNPITCRVTAVHFSVRRNRQCFGPLATPWVHSTRLQQHQMPTLTERPASRHLPHKSRSRLVDLGKSSPVCRGRGDADQSRYTESFLDACFRFISCDSSNFSKCPSSVIAPNGCVSPLFALQKRRWLQTKLGAMPNRVHSTPLSTANIRTALRSPGLWVNVKSIVPSRLGPDFPNGGFLLHHNRRRRKSRRSA